MAAFLWDAFVLHVGDGIATKMHALAAVQVVLGLGATVAVRTDESEWVEADCIVLGSNVRHALRGGRFAMLWIEPESDAGRRLVASYCRRRSMARVEVPGLEALTRRAAAMLDDPRSCDVAWRFSMDVLASVAGELPRGRVVHPAIRKTVRHIEAQPYSKISAKELATEVELSTSRLMHLFRETMGVPLRRFLMWQRLRRAVVILARGASATEAAHEAGFTDTAHLNRVLKMMLGMRPSDFQSFRSASNLTLHVCARPRRGS
jgi:AraC-like DNA-binding protein